MSEKIMDLKQLPVITTLSDADAMIVDNGKRINKANLRNVILGDINMDLIMDNVFIMYHGKNNNYPFMVKPGKWTSLQDKGEVAEGVVIIEGGKVLVVAPTECDETGLLWSSANTLGSTVIGDRVAVMNDWNGKANTASIISKSSATAITNAISYAAGFCNLYSRVNIQGYGLTAGRWWLPSVGEILMICANMAKINYALSFVTGATPLSERGYYWTSTERNTNNAWHVCLGIGDLGWNAKTTYKNRVRPVSAFIQ